MVITFNKSWDLYQWLSCACVNVKKFSKMKKKGMFVFILILLVLSEVVKKHVT